MNKRETILDAVNAERATLGLEATDAGFDYAMAIQQIMKKTNCTQESIGNRIGVSARQVGKYLDGDELPNHISGELLFGLWEDTFPDRDPRDPQWKLITPSQRKGGDPDIPPRRKRLKE